MNFISQLIKMFARMTIMRSANKLLKPKRGNNQQNNRQNNNNPEGRNRRGQNRQNKQGNQNRPNRQNRQGQVKQKTSPWIYVMAIIIAVLILYIISNKMF